jgi:predicted P-loop ATPase
MDGQPLPDIHQPKVPAGIVAATKVKQRLIAMDGNRDAETSAAAAAFVRSAVWKENLITSPKSGEPRPLLANAELALRLAPEMRGVLSFCEFSLDIIVPKSKMTPWGSGGDTGPYRWTDNDNTQAAVWLQREHGIYVPSGVAAEAALTVARDRSFHPVKDYLDSLKWDGTSRIEQWLPLYLGTANNEYTRGVGERWLISAVARIYRPGVKADCALILEGAQGIRKSTALRTLAPDWFADEISDFGSKDAAMQLRGVWIVELSELGGLNRSEVESIKAFMSRSVDHFRPPYGRICINSPRQCVFAGTTNSATYLRDESGARRFWPVACTSIDIESLARDRDQLWAEAVDKYKVGARWWLDTADLVREAESEQMDRYEGDPWDGKIADWLESRQDVSMEQVLEMCIEKPIAQWQQADKNRVARSLKALGWERYREPGPRGEKRGYRYKRSH